jgi:hypothetical protein
MATWLGKVGAPAGRAAWQSPQTPRQGRTIASREGEARPATSHPPRLALDSTPLNSGFRSHWSRARR